MNEDRLALSVTHSDGRVSRWGPDEPDPIDIPGDLTFTTQMPGGDRDLSCSLLRRIDIEYPDQGLLDRIRVYGPGNRTVWEGYASQFPRSHGDDYSINPGAVGTSAELTDDSTFTEAYVDRDPGSLTDAPFDRQVFVSAAGVSMGDFAWNRSNGATTVALPNQALGAQTVAEAWALLPAGAKVAKIMYRGASTSVPGGWQINLRATDDLTVGGDSYALTFDDTLRTQTLTTAARRYIALQLYSNGNAATPAAGALVRALHFARYGNHGLTTHSISGEPDGIYASDVVRDIVERTAPGLTIGEIEATTYPIPHLVFLEPTTGEAAIQTVNDFHGYDWGVYDGEFFYRNSDPDRLTWKARLSEGAHLTFEGETAEQIYNGVFVTYQDVLTGQKKTVGPPGSNADDTDSVLADTSSSNPVNAWGRTRPYPLTVPEATTLAGATQLGEVALGNHLAPQRRGVLTLTGTATHPSEGKVPAWRVRAGDYVSIGDHPADLPRRIIETRYTLGSRQIVCSLDNTPYMLDALFARFGAGLTGTI